MNLTPVTHALPLGAANPALPLPSGDAAPLPLGAPGAGGAPADPHEQLRHLARQLESVFLNQLFQAMRESVPATGIGDAGRGAETFRAMLDQKIADVASEKLHDHLAEALYQQLSRRLATPGPAAPAGHDASPR